MKNSIEDFFTVTIYKPTHWGKILLWIMIAVFGIGVLFKVVPKEGWLRIPGILGYATRNALDSTGQAITPELQKSGFEKPRKGFQLDQ